MTKPVTGQTTFDGATSGSVANIDSNFLLAYNAINNLNTYGNYFVDTGAANAYAVTLGANLTASLAAGLPIQFKAAHSNSGASTMDFNGGGPVGIANLDGSALSAGQIVAGGLYALQYDGALWQLQAPATLNISTLGTPVVIAGQTAINFTGLPPGIKSLTLNCADFSTTGSSPLLLQIGDAIGGIATAGYASGAQSGITAGSSAQGFVLTQGATAASDFSGSITISLENAAVFRWCSSGVLMDTATPASQVSAGQKMILATLDRIRITTENGTDQMDTGELNIVYHT